MDVLVVLELLVDVLVAVLLVKPRSTMTLLICFSLLLWSENEDNDDNWDDLSGNPCSPSPLLYNMV